MAKINCRKCLDKCICATCVYIQNLFTMSICTESSYHDDRCICNVPPLKLKQKTCNVYKEDWIKVIKNGYKRKSL